MIARTAVRRTAALGLGAVGVLVLAAPASALEVASTVEQVAEPVAGVVDPLTAPLQEAGVPVPPEVEQTIATVEKTVAEVTGQQPAPAPPPAQPGTSGSESPQQTGGPAPAEPAPAAPAPAAPAADQAVTAASVGGTGFAASPGSIAALDRASGFSSGVGTAQNPMSLFGAPQVALAPLPDAALTAPEVFTPAGGALPDLIPVGTPDSVPGYLAALACAVVAAAAGAHVAALRSRATGAPASV